MKTSLLTLLLIAGLFQSTHAQTSQLHVGVRAGGSVSFLSDNFMTLDPKRTPGFGGYAGGFVTIPLSEGWSVQPEVQYVVESGKYAEEINATSDNGTPLGKVIVTTKHQVASLRVPLLVRWCSGGFKAGSVGIVAGPVGSYILSVKDYNTMDRVISTFQRSYEDDWSKFIKQFQFGITAGVDYSITDNVSVDMRGMYSITSHLQEPLRVSLSSLSLGAGYRF
ncbi:MAG: porin family protein [Candidatus Kapaibacterium sp.]